MKRLLCFFGKHDLDKVRLYPETRPEFHSRYLIYCKRCKKIIHLAYYPNLLNSLNGYLDKK